MLSNKRKLQRSGVADEDPQMLENEGEGEGEGTTRRRGCTHDQRPRGKGRRRRLSGINHTPCLIAFSSLLVANRTRDRTRRGAQGLRPPCRTAGCHPQVEFGQGSELACSTCHQRPTSLSKTTTHHAPVLLKPNSGIPRIVRLIVPLVKYKGTKRLNRWRRRLPLRNVRHVPRAMPSVF
jgi:hypothetical protein